MSGHRPFTELTRKFTPKRKARVVARVAELKTEMALAELRQARRRSQEELARALNVNQPAVAKLEKRTDMYVSNLRRNVEALGGELRITAKFSEGEVVIGNFSDIDAPAPPSRLSRRSGDSNLTTVSPYGMLLHAELRVGSRQGRREPPEAQGQLRDGNARVR